MPERLPASQRRTLVEIAGVAGSGKSTLTRSLVGSQGDRLSRAEFIHASTPSHLPYIARGIPRFFGAYAAGLRKSPRPTWADFKLMAYVTEWDRFVMSNSDYSGRVVLFDQGPIYALVRLKVKGLTMSGTAAFESWWSRRFEVWAEVMTTVVWLDATDDVLLNRIDGRPQDHAIKGTSKPAGRQFLARYRESFQAILVELEARGVDVLRFDTAEYGSEAIASTVLSRLGVNDAS